jgi:hypothetical protein
MSHIRGTHNEPGQGDILDLLERGLLQGGSPPDVKIEVQPESPHLAGEGATAEELTEGREDGDISQNVMFKTNFIHNRRPVMTAAEEARRSEAAAPGV